MKKYTVKDLTVQKFGTGKNAIFIAHTDYEEGTWWHTIVFPDWQGNKAKATSQAVQWLNRDDVPEPYIIRNHSHKLRIALGIHPRTFFEDDYLNTLSFKIYKSK